MPRTHECEHFVKQLQPDPISLFFKLRFWLGALALIPVVIFAVVAIWLNYSTSGAAPSVREPTQRVLTSYVLSEFTGEYWENEFSNQVGNIKSLHSNDRVQFFFIIALTCDMFSYRSLIYLDALGEDRYSLIEKP